MAPGQGIKLFCYMLIQFERYHAAGITLHWRPRPVRRQLQQRLRPCKLFLPICCLGLQLLTNQPLPLPLCVIGILDRQIR